MEWVKEWLSNRVQCYTVTLRFASVSNHLRSVFCSVEYKRFTTKGEQTLSHFPEKLLITKAIYQLNNYNKAWLNTKLAKTPNLFTVEFQESLQIFWETYRYNSREFFYLHLHSYSSLANTWLSTWNRISAPIVFHNPLYPQSSVLNLVPRVSHLPAQAREDESPWERGWSVLGCSSCALGDTVFTFPVQV